MLQVVGSRTGTSASCGSAQCNMSQAPSMMHSGLGMPVQYLGVFVLQQFAQPLYLLLQLPLLCQQQVILRLQQLQPLLRV